MDVFSRNLHVGAKAQERNSAPKEILSCAKQRFVYRGYSVKILSAGTKNPLLSGVLGFKHSSKQILRPHWPPCALSEQ
jgi:hypothetical protein